jgi:hypothetical protein
VKVNPNWALAVLSFLLALILWAVMAAPGLWEGWDETPAWQEASTT